MKRIKFGRGWALLVILTLTVILAGCGKDNSQSAEVPVDLVSEITGEISSEAETTAMDETVQENYRVLLDGASDADSVYYLVDITGNGSPELIVGTETLNVYSCNQGSVTTIGSMMINTAYLSQKSGFLSFYKQDNQYELIQYQYDGEMIKENILVSASTSADYENQASQYLSDARELKAYALDDRTPFGDAQKQ